MTMAAQIPTGLIRGASIVPCSSWPLSSQHVTGALSGGVCTLQADYPEGTEFDSSDTSVYFVKAGQVQLRAADKQLEDRALKQTVAQAAAAVQTMAATGPLSKVQPAPTPPPFLPLPPSPRPQDAPLNPICVSVSKAAGPHRRHALLSSIILCEFGDWDLYNLSEVVSSAGKAL